MQINAGRSQQVRWTVPGYCLATGSEELGEVKNDSQSSLLGDWGH